MQTLLRWLSLLALVTWLGGLLFFAFVVAPVAFGHLPSTHDAGLVVGNCLRHLHWIGLGASFVLLLLAATGPRWRGTSPGAVVSELTLIVIMFALTAISQFGILPKMEQYRSAAGGVVDAAPADNPGRIGFDRLHKVSEKMEGGVLISGLLLLMVMSVEPKTGRY